MELPIDDGVTGAVQPNATTNPTIYTMQQNEIAIDSVTGELVVCLGNLVYRFQPNAISSYTGQTDFSKACNSHWIGTLI
jgi:hypothetical protein